MNTNNTNEIRNYFTEEILTQIREMSNNDMNNHLKSLKDTPVWFAMLKYVQNRTGVTQDALLVLDPLKEASKISQYQGIASGIWDLPDAVLTLNLKSKQAENPQTKKEEEINELGGAYNKY